MTVRAILSRVGHALVWAIHNATGWTVHGTDPRRQEAQAQMTLYSTTARTARALPLSSYGHEARNAPGAAPPSPGAPLAKKSRRAVSPADGATEERTLDGTED